MNVCVTADLRSERGRTCRLPLDSGTRPSHGSHRNLTGNESDLTSSVLSLSYSKAADERCTDQADVVLFVPV